MSDGGCAHGIEPQHMPSVAAEAVCLARWCSMPVASAEAVCEALCARCGVSYMVEPQRVPVWVCEARCEAVCLSLDGVLCR